MLQVTLQQQLATFDRQISELIKWRSTEIDVYEARVAWVNREFDKRLHELHRCSERVQREMGPAPAPHSPRGRKSVELVGLTPDEQEHFQELRAKSGSF